ncbi:MAG TPA: VTT domain-containing protein [Polyangiaceae bacterium]|nr:VTT domain-containing protein [Polyangiaceae bacterium]
MRFEPDKNCWRVTHADRLAFLVDGAAYFAAFRKAAIQARRSIVMVGWDFDSHVRLLPEGAPNDGFPPTLLPFLNALCERTAGLSIYVLAWDFSLIYTFEREPLPAVKFAWRSHRRVRFALDGEHPVGASHHQKIVVVDDRVAFVGGMDLTFARWDTPEHRPHDKRRATDDGTIPRPMHDVQVAVAGETAAALGDLFRERWKAATGQILRSPGPPAATNSADGWPAGVPADVEHTEVAIARTVPAMTAQTESIREIEAMTLAAIAAAKQTIFIENQYLTSALVGNALAERLEEVDGPEVILILPRDQGGWLEQSSMGVLRDRLLARLRASDRHGRLRAYYPAIPGLPEEQCLGVHSKVLIVDDALLKVGSANLSNRSMGFDTECDIALAAIGERSQENARAIAALRARLLGEHLGVELVTLEERYTETKSWIAAIDSLAGAPRTLLPLGPGPAPAVNLAVMDGLVCDPEQPVSPEKLIAEFVPAGSRRRARRSLLHYAVLLAMILLVGTAWRFTPLRELLVVERLVELGRSVRDSPLSFLYVTGAYLLGGFVFFPITLLIAGTALLFDPLRGFAFALVGSLTSACATYGVGRLAGRPVIERMLRTPRMRRFRDELRRRSFAAVFGARLVPVGSFSLINLLAGALGVRFRSYLLGNVFGILPGILGLTLFAARLENTLARPDIGNIVVLTVVLAAIVGALSLIRRALRRAGRMDSVTGLREIKES